MQIVYSPSAHAAGNSAGFYFSDDKNAPSDSFPIADSDHAAAINLPPGSTYIFVAPAQGSEFGTLSTVGPSQAFLLLQAQTAQIAQLQADYQAELMAPVQFKNSAGVTSTYPAGKSIALNGETAMKNLESVIDGGASGWTLGVWLDTNNVAQTFTFTDLQGLAAAMDQAGQVDWHTLIQQIAAVQAATTVAEVQTITW